MTSVSKQGIPLTDFLKKSGLHALIQNNYSQYIIPTCRFMKRERVHKDHPFDTFFFEIDVTRNLCNAYNALHGGASATIVDFLSSCALFAIEARGSVTVDLSLAYPSAAKLGETITIETRVLKYGRNLVFAEASIKVGDRLIIHGRHTKMLVSSKTPKTSSPIQSKM